MRRAKKKKVDLSEDGPSATAAPATRKPGGKPAPAVGKRPRKGTPAAVCLQVQLEKALEAAAEAYTDYFGLEDYLKGLGAEIDANEKELDRLKGWLDLEPSDLGEPESQLWQQWRRGVEKVRGLMELRPVFLRLCDVYLKKVRRARDAWKACEVKVQVAASAVAAAKK